MAHVSGRDVRQDSVSSTHAYKVALDMSIRRDNKISGQSVATNNKASPTQLNYQKWWLLFHALIWFCVCSIAIVMLKIKQDEINKFYDQSQCCYCLWAGHNDNVTSDYKIEWSPCEQYLDSKLQHTNLPYSEFTDLNNANSVCDINGTTYCTSENSTANYTVQSNDIFEHTDDKFSTTSTIIYLQFTKWYSSIYYIYIIAIISVYYISLSIFSVIMKVSILWHNIYGGSIYICDINLMCIEDRGKIVREVISWEYDVNHDLLLFIY